MSRLPTACHIVPIEATVVPQKQSIAIEEMANYLLTIHNQGEQTVDLCIDVEGVNKHWLMISPPHLTLREWDSAKIVISITPPRLNSSQAGDYQLTFIIRSPERIQPSWHHFLEADLTIEPFTLSSSDLLTEGNSQKAHDKDDDANLIHRYPKGTLLQTFLLMTLCLGSCLLLSTFIWLPFKAWAMGTQEFKESLPFRFTLPKEETASLLTETESQQSAPILSPTALTEPILIAPNWSAPLSTSTPLATITFIPTATATPTSHQTPILTDSPTASLQPKASSMPTASPFYATFSPTALIPKEEPQPPSNTPSTTLPTEPPPTTIQPPESDSRLFASMPTLLMIEPATTELTYEEMFQQIGAQYAIDWRLLASVAYQESSLNPQAVGKDGEMGLMQILPTTWDEFAPEVGVSDPFDPYSNVQVGAAYLNYLRGYLVSQGYSEEYWTLVAYNWGPQKMRQLMQQRGNWGDVPPSRQNYAYQIIERVNDYNNHWFESKLKEEITSTNE